MDPHRDREETVSQQIPDLTELAGGGGEAQVEDVGGDRSNRAVSRRWTHSELIPTPIGRAFGSLVYGDGRPGRERNKGLTASTTKQRTSDRE